jgi:hypothetical protein
LFFYSSFNLVVLQSVFRALIWWYDLDEDKREEEI